MTKESIVHRAGRLCRAFVSVSVFVLALLPSSSIAMVSLSTGESSTAVEAVPKAGITFMDPMQIAQRNSQNDRFRNRYEQWQNMRPDEKETMRRRMDQWNRMAPQEQKLYQQRYNQWKDLSPEEQKQIDRKLEKWKELSPSEKEDVRKRFR